MSKLIARLVVGLACAYAAGAVAYGFFGYEEGRRPDVPGVLSDFNGWLAGFVTSRAPDPKPPAAPPAPPAPAEPSTPAPEAAPAAPADPEERELARIEKEVLPKARELGRALRAMDRGDAEAFEGKRTEGMALLGDARTFLNGLLEREPRHKRANALWSQLQEIYRALKSL